MPSSSGSTHPSSAYGPRRSNRSPPSNSGMPIAMPGMDIHPFCPLNASFDSSFALSRFFLLIASVSSFESVPLRNPLTFLRRDEISDSTFTPRRRFRNISCCASQVVSRPALSLSFSNQPARVIAARSRPRDALDAARGARARARAFASEPRDVRTGEEDSARMVRMANLERQAGAYLRRATATFLFALLA
eukprot:29380-Pelagococcus_subviridis.AAC.1